jgi:four helix bundle protein
MTNIKNQKFNLQERTAVFGENAIDFIKTLKENNLNRPIINQFIRSATSIGANYMEADAGESKRDFTHKIGICKKEAKETLHWLRMLARTETQNQETCRKLWQECHELVLIFSAINKKR